MSQPALQITFLGTGTSSGVPMIGCDCEVCASTDPRDKRLRSSVLIRGAGTTLVIDSGPDFRQQMLTANVRELDAVLLTHSHKDHIAGLDDIRAYNYFQQRDMQVFGSKATLDRVKIEFDYAFQPIKYPGIPAIQLNEISESPFRAGNLEVLPIPVWHLKMPVLGFRVGIFTYITDANRIEESSKNKIRGSKVLVLNALRHEPHISHFTLKEALDMADELEIPEVYFTHISHQMGFHSLVDSHLPLGRHLAWDGLAIQV